MTTASWRALGPPPDGGMKAWVQGVFFVVSFLILRNGYEAGDGRLEQG